METATFAEGWIPSAFGWWWQREDGTFPCDQWEYIDGNNDGIAECYYFDENGILLTDTICPDYSIVNKDGNKLDRDGNVITKQVEIRSTYQREQSAFQGAKSEGSIRSDKIGVTEKPEVVADKGTLVMKGVELKEDDVDSASRKLEDNIVGGDKYSKSVTAKVTGNIKWKDAMALNGEGAYIIFKNPGFRILRGKVSHEYKSTTDDTHCCINLIIDDLEFTTIEEFDFKKEETFSFELPEDSMKIKLELTITGDHTDRKVYLKDLFYRK